MSDKVCYKIGYALTEKKLTSFVQPSLVEMVKSIGIDLVPVDSSKPLVEQGPFDAILHKLPGKSWNEQLRAYSQKYPYVIIIDPPEAVEKLHNRVSMLQAVQELKICGGSETFGVPLQIIVETAEKLKEFRISTELKFPVIAKPLIANGSADSHSMSLVFNAKGLEALRPPLVLQEFVNHGGVIFKVYVVGDFVKCVKRKSLPDISDDKMQSSAEGFMLFSQISNMSSEGYDQGFEFEKVELPHAKFIQDLASGLRAQLGLRLFNFDIIRDSRDENRYLVIDINYFPGYAKMPGYEAVLTDFFCNLFNEEKKASRKKISSECSGIDDQIFPVECGKDIANDNKGEKSGDLAAEEM